MLSDIISDAESHMRDYLETRPEPYEWLRSRIDSLLREMGRVRFMLDLKGTPLESVWVHTRPISLLLDQEPLDHEQLNKLIDPVLDAGPPTKEQFQEWAKLLLDQNEGRQLDPEQIGTLVDHWKQVPGNMRAAKKRQPKSR